MHDRQGDARQAFSTPTTADFWMRHETWTLWSGISEVFDRVCQAGIFGVEQGTPRARGLPIAEVHED